MNKEDALRFEMIKAAAYKTELKEIGKKEGKRENLERNIKTMSSKGYKPEVIADALDVDLTLVKEVLGQK